ncbi:MAG TPA: hypothetical protein DD379_09655 [Cyanobacteria bacterium UBA11162]|nr:hypothetical protein [Cyanobacteria bacterium UBA11162]
MPGHKHWQAVESLPEMEPQDFVKYWDVSYVLLAELCHCTPRTVYRWFSSRNPQPASSLHKFRLAIIHKVWIGLSSHLQN